MHLGTYGCNRLEHMPIIRIIIIDWQLIDDCRYQGFITKTYIKARSSTDIY